MGYVWRPFSNDWSAGYGIRALRIVRQSSPGESYGLRGLGAVNGEFFGQQARGHAAHEEEAVYRALLVRQHLVAVAGGNRATVFNPAIAMRPQRVQQRKRLVGSSVPRNPSCHARADPL
jgi:hypothetical protein